MLLIHGRVKAGFEGVRDAFTNFERRVDHITAGLHTALAELVAVTASEVRMQAFVRSA